MKVNSSSIKKFYDLKITPIQLKSIKGGKCELAVEKLETVITS